MAEYRDRNVFAVRGGIVSRVGWENPDDHRQGFGYRIWLRAPDGSEEVYAHMEPGSIRYRVGEQVLPGIHVGRYGDPSNGSSSGPHLHYGVRDATGKWVDPGDAMPVFGGEVHSPWGMRRHPISGLEAMHHGRDIRGPLRQPPDVSFP
jgi:murein DD-endopeptidase MepM/ murein hydrolase activator NlpD